MLIYLSSVRRCWGAEVLLTGSKMEEELCTDVIVLYLFLLILSSKMVKELPSYYLFILIAQMSSAEVMF